MPNWLSLLINKLIENGAENYIPFFERVVIYESITYPHSTSNFNAYYNTRA